MNKYQIECQYVYARYHLPCMIRYAMVSKAILFACLLLNYTSNGIKPLPLTVSNLEKHEKIQLQVYTLSSGLETSDDACHALEFIVRLSSDVIAHLKHDPAKLIECFFARVHLVMLNNAWSVNYYQRIYNSISAMSYPTGLESLGFVIPSPEEADFHMSKDIIDNLISMNYSIYEIFSIQQCWLGNVAYAYQETIAKKITLFDWYCVLCFIQKNQHVISSRTASPAFIRDWVHSSQHTLSESFIKRTSNDSKILKNAFFDSVLQVYANSAK